MTNVLGLPLDTALEALGRKDMRVQELETKRPRSTENKENTAPREFIPRGTLRVVRQTEDVLTVCRFTDRAAESTETHEETADEDIRKNKDV